ncbi:hypothetical protein JD79_03107 [Geodermatophilus normandii]|uniref:ATP-binding protein n=1 Tax=Geodermatophilus normandii TaxID=1137989 RepID=A0A317QQI4_9ACTN|nr:hypothetical protein [Geodermatophilus normandii]PWW23930.1 hypothetical protein JD79_03107 [Geodermatophilus normandii]
MTEGAAREGLADPRRPQPARAWVRAAGEAEGWPPAVVDELLLLLSEVLAADLAGSGRHVRPRPVRLLADGTGLEVQVGGWVAGGDRLGVAAAAVTAVRLEAPGDGWVRLVADGGCPAPG